MVIEGNREDSAVVYRYLRAHGPDTVPGIALACFPLRLGTADPLYARLFKKSVKRTLQSIEWIRAQGVDVTVTPWPGDLSRVSIEPVT